MVALANVGQANAAEASAGLMELAKTDMRCTYVAEAALVELVSVQALVCEPALCPLAL